MFSLFKPALKVPLANQPKNSSLCGPYGLQMLYSFYRIPRTADQITKDIPMFSWGAFVSDLATDLVKHGFDVKYVAWESRYFPRTYQSMSQAAMARDLRMRARKQKEKDMPAAFKGLANFIEQGGVLEPRIVKLKEIIAAIRSGQPPLLCIEQNCLYKVDGIPHPSDSGHFIIPTAYKDGVFTINDPYWDTTKPYKLTKDQLLFALYSWRGHVLFVKKSVGLKLA